MTDLDCSTIEKFKLWSLNGLKVFLSCRKKSVDGSFDELAARAFCAWEENLPVDSSVEEAERRLCVEYTSTSKLKAGGLFPFPTTKKNPESRDKWKRLVGRESGNKLWSPSKDSRVCSSHFVDGEPTMLSYL
ncbi:hypothetical protein ACF0H5_016872 [Mactra antiquata]